MGFGSTVGTIDPSKDYLAAAIGNSGMALGQGIANAGQGIAQGIVNKRENDFRNKQLAAQTDANKLSQWNRAVDDLNQEFAPLAKRLDEGTISQEEFDSVYKPRRAQIDSQFAPPGVGQPPVDNLSKAIGTPPVAPTVPQQAPQPQPIINGPRGQVFKVDAQAPQDNLATAFSAPVAQPPQQPEQAPAPQVQVQAPTLTSLRETAAKRTKEAKDAEEQKKTLGEVQADIFAKFHVGPTDLANDSYYSQFDINTLDGARAIEAEAGRRFDEKQNMERLKIAKATGADAANRDAIKQTAKDVPDLDTNTKAVNKNFASLQSQYANFKAQVERGDLNAARATAQGMQGLINSLNGQGAMGDAERAGLLGSIENFSNVSDPDQFRVGRDWQQMQRQFSDTLKGVDKVRLQAYYDNGYTLSGKVRLFFPDGHSEAVEPNKAKQLILNGKAAYVGRWDSLDQVKRY